MTAPLTPKEVRAIADLARLELRDDELTALTGQLAAILHYVDLLGEVDTSNVEPLAHALDVTNVFRDDEPAPSLPVQEALANAPARKMSGGAGFYAVPPVQELAPCWSGPRGGSWPPSTRVRSPRLNSPLSISIV